MGEHEAAPPHAASAAPPGGAATHRTSHETTLLRRHALPVETFVADVRGRKFSPSELARRFGSSVAPVPVPLARGESERQYEERFVAWLARRAVKLSDFVHDANRERSYRVSFAEHVADAHITQCWQRETTGQAEDYLAKNGRVIIANVPRRLLLAHEYMSLEQYRRDAKNGRFKHLAGLSFAEKQRRFGSPYAPIHVPLAPGETPEMYEERFVKWLETKRNRTLRELETHPVLLLERNIRMDFVMLNATGKERFVAPRASQSLKDIKRDRGHDDTAPPAAKKVKEEENDDACGGQDSLEACRACGCRRCLLRAIGLLATAIFTLEGKASAQKCSCERDMESTEVLDVLLNGSSDATQTMSGSSSAGAVNTDANTTGQVEQQLLEEFDTQNELVVMNKSALDDSAAELVELATNDIAEATRRRDEDDEMRELIHEEVQKRSAALATLLVYMYRSDLAALEAMVSAQEVSDIVHVQRVGYLKCMELASEIAETEAQLAEGVEEEGKSQADVEEKMQGLRDRRRRELVRVVHFDERVRVLIRA